MSLKKIKTIIFLLNLYAFVSCSSLQEKNSIFRSMSSIQNSVYCLERENFSFAKIENPEDSFECKNIDIYDHHIGKVFDSFSIDAEKINIIFMRVVDRVATYDVYHSKLELESIFDPSRELDANLIYLTHELGHNLFNSFIAKRSKPYLELVTLNQNIDKYFDGLIKIALKHGLEACQGGDSKCLDEIDDYKLNLPPEIKNAEQRLHEFKNKNRYLESWNQILSPFHELFADVVTSIFYEDPGVITSSSEFAEKCRSFNRKFELPKDIEASPYCKLAEVRHDLWKKWIMNRLEDKKNTLTILGDVIADAAILSIESGNVDPNAFAKYLQEKLSY